KAEVLRNSLVASGENAAEVARIIAPAGESIGAQTPEEIALSVLTSVVAAQRGRTIHSEPAPSLTQTAAPVGMASGVAAARCCSAAAPAATPVTTSATGPTTTGSCCGGGNALADTTAPRALSAVPAVPALGPASCCKA
ncbi:MAG: XdhC family protein, partial [Rhodoferax sp.]|nr:XdhC family protein [Rhodoferax sp.]